MAFELKKLQNSLIGNSTEIKTPYGNRVITYADYTASGRAVSFIENNLLDFEKYYANSHTQDSYTGKHTTHLVHESIDKIKESVNGANHYVFPTGSGSTGGIKRFAEIMGIYCPPALKAKIKVDKADLPVVFIGPYEHHSNELMWREGYCEVVQIGITEAGDIDTAELERHLTSEAYQNRVKIGSFSASSNVTGIKSDVYGIAKLLHEHNALACFDFAASAPYVDINVNKDELSYFDAVYISPHKFLGGPGTCGLLILHKDVYRNNLPPTTAGGGTVDFVNHLSQDYTEDVEAREMAGTPGILQILKTRLAFELKATIGNDRIEEIENNYNKHVFARLAKNDRIEILGNQDPNKRISIFSFNVKSGDAYLHHAFVTTLLNDLFGIQSRAGCACAGPYGHLLLGIDDSESEKYRHIITNGLYSLKQGWVRVNFHYIFSQAQVDFICDAIEFIAEYGHLFLDEYELDIHSGIWKSTKLNNEAHIAFGIQAAIDNIGKAYDGDLVLPSAELYKQYLAEATDYAKKLATTFKADYSAFPEREYDRHKWYLTKLYSK